MKQHLKNKELVTAILAGFGLLAISFAINSYAVAYATLRASNSVSDIVLSNTSVFNVDGLFVYGAVIWVAVIVLVCFANLPKAPFILKSLAFFITIRAFFLSLTHINPYPQHIAITPNIVTNLFPSFFTGSDLFFSGHTGAPFLLALNFWDNALIRNIFLGFSIVFAIVVLLGHLHYSIDVASAYFITFTIFTLAKSVFKRDWERFKNGESN